jgi:hypothetical protein
MLPPTKVTDTMMHAGAVRVEITPAAGFQMDGYSDREGGATGAHDPLWARVLVIEVKGRRVVLVSCDLVGIDTTILSRVRDAAATLAGESGVFISATHTHSGPAGARAPVNEEVAGIVTGGIVRGLHAAMERRVPARLGDGWGHALGVGANRRDPAAPYDPVLGVLRVDAMDGRPIAVMVNFACHPTVLPASNLLYSSDYPGVAVTAMERQLDDAVVLFTNGAAGDISTRFTRSASSFEEAERLGGILASASLDVHARILPGSVTRLLSATRIVQLPPPPVPPIAVVEAELEAARRNLERARAAGVPHGQERIARTAVQGLERQMARARQGAAPAVEAELGAFAIDGVCGVAWPGEVFNAYAAELRRRAHRPVFVLGYTNGLIGYVPTPEAFAAGGYEATSARVGPTAGAAIVDTSLSLLRDVTAGG